VFSYQVWAGFFLKVTLKHVNVTWIERNPVFSGKLSHCREALTSSTCFKRSLPAAEENVGPLRFRYSQDSPCLCDPAFQPVLTWTSFPLNSGWSTPLLRCVLIKIIHLRHHTCCTSQIFTWSSTCFTGGTNGYCLGTLRAIQFLFRFTCKKCSVASPLYLSPFKDLEGLVLLEE